MTIPHSHPGKVWLVGAGPGDPELLTLKAVKAIAAADVILMDDLVHPDVLAHARADARIVAVGKRGGCKSTPQEFIERLMLQEALAGRQVVRLKGGDPYLFGRGGEERAGLLAQGVEVEVVNGVSSGFAATAAIGVPLTHRDHAHGVVFVTGQAAQEGGEVDWALLAATGLTLVVYMGVARAEQIRTQLLAAGLAAALPVAVVQSASTAEQRAIVSTLEAFPADMAAAGLGSPAIIVIGEVVRLADQRLLTQWASQAGQQARA
jgi:uroporphyrin-III C-methyltransferase